MLLSENSVPESCYVHTVWLYAMLVHHKQLLNYFKVKQCHALSCLKL